MLITIDFNSDEAIYMQLRNQVIIAIAMDRLQDGDALPSVRQLADDIGINMHTVNKAYSVLRQEGIVKLDRRHGAIVSLDYDKLQAIQEMKNELDMVIAKAICKNISIEDIHSAVESIFNDYRKE